MQGNHVGTVARRTIRIFVRLDEYSRYPNSDRRSREYGDKPPLTTGARSLSTRLLDAMRGIEHNRTARLGENGQSAHIADQRVVAEARAPFREQDFVIPGASNFVGDVRHVPRRQELTLLHVDSAACASRSQQQICLPAKKCGNLQDVDNRGHRCTLAGLVHVRHYRAAELRLYFRKYIKGLGEADSPSRTHGRAIGLIETALINEGHADRARHLHQCLRGLQCMRA